MKALGRYTKTEAGVRAQAKQERGLEREQRIREARAPHLKTCRVSVQVTLDVEEVIDVTEAITRALHHVGNQVCEHTKNPNPYAPKFWVTGVACDGETGERLVFEQYPLGSNACAND